MDIWCLIISGTRHCPVTHKMYQTYKCTRKSLSFRAIRLIWSEPISDFRDVWLTGDSHHLHDRASVCRWKLVPTYTWVEWGKRGLIIFPKDKTRSTDGWHRTLDLQIQSPMLYRLNQRAPHIYIYCNYATIILRGYLVTSLPLAHTHVFSAHTRKFLVVKKIDTVCLICCLKRCYPLWHNTCFASSSMYEWRSTTSPIPCHAQGP